MFLRIPHKTLLNNLNIGMNSIGPGSEGPHGLVGVGNYSKQLMNHKLC